MEDLIEVLQILKKYDNSRYPTYCNNEALLVNVDPDLVSDEDKARLEELSFLETEDGFESFRFGSC